MATQNLGRVVGLSAYETWKKQSGNSTKTEAEFIASLKGAKGDTGAQGIQGLKGDTGSQGIQGVKGDKGDTGAKGADGVVGTFSIDSSGNLIYTT